MHIYRFNVILENSDDFYFDIDIMPNQTFLDFHNAIQNVMKFSSTELASFYISNSSWKKKTEICLIDMSLEEDADLYEDDDDNKPKKKKTLIMADVVLKSIIEDPHQRFIYIYDFLTPWTFYIELFKIIESEKGAKYPLCSKLTGELPTKKANIAFKNPIPDIGDTELLLDDDILDEPVEDDDSFDELGKDEADLEDGFDELKF